ncbi:MAG: OmpA family protein [Bacteroidota bacterium]
MRTLVFIFAVLQSVVIHAQVKPAGLCTTDKKAILQYTEADNYRVRGQFREAIRLLESALERDSKFCEAYYRLALVYRSRQELSTAEQLLLKGLSVTTLPAKQKVFWYELGDLKLSTGAYTAAAEWLRKFLSAETTNKVKAGEARRLLDNCEYALSHKADDRFVTQPLSDTVNRFVMQYFPVLTADERMLFFTRRNGKTDRDTEDIVVSERDASGAFGPPVSLSPLINTPENEGTCTVSADGRQIIFTSCRGRAGFGNCDLFESRKTGDQWSEPVNLGSGVNSSAWESQPSLSADGRVLFFVSDRRGGIGSRDLYRAEKGEDGKWQQSVNLGPALNTRFDEISPFIHANGTTLFFASNGRPGFGGYDLYATTRLDSAWKEPENFGAPVNNHEDQFSLFISADGLTGYYSHEEDRDQHSGRIYTFRVPEPLRIRETSSSVRGIISDRKNGRPVKARVELVNLATRELVSLSSSDSLNGQYLIVLNKGADYGLFVSAPRYLFQSLNFSHTGAASRPVVLDIALEPVQAGAAVVLKNIFFDYDSYALKAESYPELDKAVRFMRDNPTLRIEISGHTDNTGAEARNRTLSLNRANAVVAYFMDKGVAKSRLTVTGSGSSRPIAPNDTEENRARNRRIEFVVLP